MPKYIRPPTIPSIPSASDPQFLWQSANPHRSSRPKHRPLPNFARSASGTRRHIPRSRDNSAPEPAPPSKEKSAQDTHILQPKEQAEKCQSALHESSPATDIS